MKSPLLLTLLLLNLGGAELPRGAKELFFDPDGLAVTSVIASVPFASRVRPEPEQARHARREVEARAVEGGNFGLSYWIELVETDDQLGRPVTAKRTFFSGERIRLHFQSNMDGYISLIQLGASGQSNILFPAATQGLGDNVLRAGEERLLPHPEAWFRFDPNAGEERLIVVFAARTEEVEAISGRRSAPAQGEVLLALARAGSKDLLLETETRKETEIGAYVVNKAGEPIILEIVLKHR